MALGAYSSISPAGLFVTSRPDPFNTPADQIGIAAGLPDFMKQESGEAVPRTGFVGGDAVSTYVTEEEWPLQLTARTSTGLAANAPDETIYLARLTSADAATFGMVQTNRTDGFSAQRRQIDLFKASSQDEVERLLVRLQPG